MYDTVGSVLDVVEDVLDVKVVLEVLLLLEVVDVVELVVEVLSVSFAIPQDPLEGSESPPALKARTT